MSTLFSIAVDGVLENNANGNKWSDWDDSDHILETYCSDFSGSVSPKEMEATKTALDRLISSDGKEWDKVVNEWNLKVWGKRFADNSGPTPYTG
jgi:hypothetical protein